MNKKRRWIIKPRFRLLMGMALLLVSVSIAQAADEHPLLPLMESEMKLSMDKLAGPDGSKPYYLQYEVTDEKSMRIAATLGSITYDDVDHSRYLDVDIRCGDYTLDNTHQIRGGFGGFGGRGGWTLLPLNNDPTATRQAIWLRTDEAFKSAVNRLAQVQANVKVKVEEEDQSDDFSREKASVSISPWLSQEFDRQKWVEKARLYAKRFREHPDIYSSSVTISAEVDNRLAVNSEGSKLQYGLSYWRIGVQASTIAEDGMELYQYDAFDSHTPEGLPDDDAVFAAIDQVIKEVLGLRAAPIVEPYIGPAILMNRASGVFFHEIFGHRIEGHRQKDVEEGQTFAKKVGQQILPEFMTIVDDPSQRTFNGTDLRGHYPFDNECVPGQPARIVENGVLRTFLLSRSPTRGFTESNGHGRREPGSQVFSRQGNLMIESTKKVPFDELRSMMIEECKKQGKEFGLVFEDISGGFTTTRVRGPQAFKVIPLVVYKVYTDGRPDELVRGVDIVGTPLTSFSKIIATGDDPGVFNGTCGAESGSVPVSAVSPSVLVQQIEVEKKQKAQDRPPILDAPIADESDDSAS